jgi:hypothetical protein
VAGAVTGSWASQASIGIIRPGCKYRSETFIYLSPHPFLQFDRRRVDSDESINSAIGIKVGSHY